MFKDVWNSIWEKIIEAFRCYEILNFSKKKSGFAPSSAEFKFWANYYSSSWLKIESSLAFKLTKIEGKESNFLQAFEFFVHSEKGLVKWTTDIQLSTIDSH